MSRESYAKGFVKAANSYGVDPVALAKFAAGNVGSDGRSVATRTEGQVPKSVSDMLVRDGYRMKGVAPYYIPPSPEARREGYNEDSGRLPPGVGVNLKPTEEAGPGIPVDRSGPYRTKGSANPIMSYDELARNIESLQRLRQPHTQQGGDVNPFYWGLRNLMPLYDGWSNADLEAKKKVKQELDAAGYASPGADSLRSIRTDEMKALIGGLYDRAIHPITNQTGRVSAPVVSK